MSEKNFSGQTPRNGQPSRDTESAPHTSDARRRHPYAETFKTLFRVPDFLKTMPRTRMFRAFCVVVALLLVVIAAAIASHADTAEPEPGITSDMLREQLEYVRDLVTVEYHYTDAERQEIPPDKLFNLIPLPWTKKVFIISYDGVIKYGVDVSQVGISVNGIAKAVTIEIPRAKIISHEIPEEGFRVLYESSGPFNRIKIDDVTVFRMARKERMEDKAADEDIPRKAQEQSGGAILALLRAVPGMEEYTLNVEYTE